jgi:hypothetical protein
VVPNPWFGREIAVRPSDVVVLVMVSLLSGALTATYTVAGAGRGTARAGIGSAIIGWFAVGCPVCNKLVVALVGAYGAAGSLPPRSHCSAARPASWRRPR